MAGRTVIVGDIHSCFDELMDLFARVELRPEDHLVTIGDTVVKGPQPREVLRHLLARPRTTCLLGNMEWRLLEAVDNDEQDRLPRIHRETLLKLTEGWDEFEAGMKTWPLHLDLGEVLCVHAGLVPGRSLEDQTSFDLLHMRRVELSDDDDGPARSAPWWKLYQGPKPVVFGHTVFKEPLVTECAIGLDTGCVYGGRLTALVLPGREIVQVPARTVHASVDIPESQWESACGGDDCSGPEADPP